MATFLEHVEAIPEFVTYKAALRESLALRPGDVVLDVGCGIGTHAARIAAEHDGPVWAVDRGPMLAEARERGGARATCGGSRARPRRCPCPTGPWTPAWSNAR